MWIPITLVAAVCQTLRTAAQQRLRSTFSVNGAGFVRFAFGAPFAVAAVAIVAVRCGAPALPGRFWLTVCGAGVAQILGTNALIHSFGLRSFAIGTVYAKTEVVQVGVLSWLLLGEPLHPLAWVGAAVVLAGVVILTLSRTTPSSGPNPGGTGRRLLQTLAAVRDPAALFGILAGGLFGLAAVWIRASSNSLGEHPAVVRALVTLAVMNTIQTGLQGAYLVARQPGELRLARIHWRRAVPVGGLSVLGSAGWAWAMTIQNAAVVRTVGQVELLLTFTVSALWLHERHPRRDYAASALVLVGVIIVMVVG
ncbi:MAG: EamA family transporter [Ilumatobacteraceae bacterium]